MQSIFATDDATPRKKPFITELSDGSSVKIVDDHFSDRLRCDHPDRDLDGEALGKTLKRVAEKRERGRIVALVDSAVAEGLSTVGFREEAEMPGFYKGERPCVVMGAFPDPERRDLAAPALVEKVERLVEEQSPQPPARPDVVTELATPDHAEEIAALMTATFPQYPTPSGDPSYVAESIEEGTPFRMVRQEGDVVACASADLVQRAETAELTDCATLPEYRGNGFMQAILLDLMDDLRDMDYPTAFTLARARIPGVNLAFCRLGFELCGTMAQSCRIGQGIEDMNVWSRSLVVS
jgi:putative beta-lysine N-acetyltransferase